jgi:flagellar biosynthesis GTPase FlhF
MAVEENELDQRVSDWLEHKKEMERSFKNKSSGKIKDWDAEEQKEQRDEMSQIFSERASNKRKADMQTAASEDRERTDSMMGLWEKGLDKSTTAVTSCVRDTFAPMVTGPVGEMQCAGGNLSISQRSNAKLIVNWWMRSSAASKRRSKF